MNKIKSFEIDHDRLKRGVYLSRKDGNVLTYDLRFKEPNKGDYLENPALHTIEHLFATYLRNSRYKNSVIYFGPMGCRTGFYLLLLDDMTREEVLSLIRESLAFIIGYEGEIPGAKKKECGNYRDHDLKGAKKEASEYLCVLEDYRGYQMDYENNYR